MNMKMLRRPRIILPCINVAGVAVVLALANVQTSHRGGVGPPQVAFSYMIEAPAALFRKFVVSLWDSAVAANCSVVSIETCYSAGGILGNCVFLAAVAMLWYVVGLEIESWDQEKRAVVPARTSSRIAVDLALVLVGVFFGFLEVAIWRDLSWVSWPRALLGALPYALWATAFAGAYGQDLLRCIGNRDRTPGRST